jgi:uncharacterized protein YcbK (DUF882 family)
VPVGKARLKAIGLVAARAGYSCGLAVLLIIFASRSLQNAIAEGDTRTITMHHIHTDEDITITYKREGRYDEAALQKLDWFLRDWRRSEQTGMDPHLIDLVWEVQRESGTKDPIWVVCGYRSPQTNAMLRHRSSGVARFSQHMLGRAMDFYIPGIPLEQLRVIGLRLARGGVGFYPSSGSPFVHMDTGSIRMWPRMSREELVRVFPDGKTVQIPTDGHPLPGYAVALAEIRNRGNSPSDNSIDAARSAGMNVGTVVASNQHIVNPFAKLLGLAKDEEDEDPDAIVTASAAPTPQAAPVAPPKPKPAVVTVIERTAEKTAAATERVAKAAETKLVQTASLVHVTRAEAATNPPPPPDVNADRYAALTPNQIITARGYWAGSPDGAATAKPAQAALKNALRARRTDVASITPDTTGATGPWPSASQDHVPPELALAYAEQPDHDSPAQAVAQAAAAASAAAAGSGELIAENGTTVAMKGVIDRPQSSVQRAIALASAAVKVGTRFDNPWMRAVILSPSVHRFLTTLALGARDFTSLASLMVKPASSVMMTFSSDPSPGLSHDHFSGSAIVFLSTVTYPTHTASLQ